MSPSGKLSSILVSGLLLAALGATASSASAAALLGTAGDIACDPNDGSFNDGKGSGSGTNSRCRQLATSDLLVGMDRVISLGDAQYEHGSLRNFQRSYDLSWGRFLSVTRPVVGNHEYGTPQQPNLGADGYWDYFGEERAGSRNRGWYSYDLDGWHIIALNSQCKGSRDPRTMQHEVGCNAGSPQHDWLKSDLAANQDKKCVIAAFHHPRFSSGLSGGWSEVKPFWEALYAARADVVLSAHDHVYERFAKKTPGGSSSSRGLREFMVGTGGKNVSKFGTIKSGSQARIRQHGVLQLVLGEGNYQYSFRRAGDGQSLDSGSPSCV
jgi:acid phosphatase type 7